MLYRFIPSERTAFDKKGRTLKACIATETPVARKAPANQKLVPAGEEILEVLDQSPENADLSLLNPGAFLDEHNTESQLGTATKATVDSDRVSRSLLRFDSHQLATTRFAQMKSGTRPFISTGYVWTRLLSRSQAPDGKTVCRFAWKALEVSSVAIPADRNAAVGRSHITEQHSMQTTENETENRDSIAEIRALAGALKRDWPNERDTIDNLHRQAVVEGWSTAAFKRAVWDLPHFKPAPTVPTMQGLGASARDCREYSLLRGIQSCIRRNQAVPDGLEGEFHRALEAQNLGIEPQGFLCPLDANIRLPNRMQRDMQATVFATGGAFVPSQLVMPVIEILRNFLILNKVGVRVMAGLVGNILLPRQEAAATAYAVPEIGPLSDSGQILGQLAMAPHRVGATQTYSKQFVMQSTPDAEAFLRDDLFKVIALQHDRLGINGQGAGSEPLGVMNTPGINSILFGGTATYQQIVNMATAIRTMNVREPLAYISTPTSRGRLQTVPELLLGATILGGAQNALWKPSIDPTESRVNGWPAYDTNQIPNNQMLCGAFEHLVQGIWGGLDVVVDIFTKAKQAETVITINTWIDWAVRHAQAFTVSADSAAQ